MTYQLSYDLSEKEKELQRQEHTALQAKKFSLPERHLDTEQKSTTGFSGLLTKSLQSSIKTKNPQINKSNVASLQRLAGNKATKSLVLQRVGPTQQDIKYLKEHHESAEKADNATNSITNINTVLTPGSVMSGLGTATGNATSQGGGQTGTSALGTLISGGALVTDSIGLHHRIQKWRKAKKSGIKDVEHVTKRQVKISSANVATDAGGFTTGVVNTASGGLAISSALNTTNTALATTSGVTGVVGAAITLPLQLAMMIRQIIRSEKQRKRMMRIKGLKNLTSATPQAALKSKQDAFDAAEKSLADIKDKLVTVTGDHNKSKIAVDDLKKNISVDTSTISEEEKKLNEQRKLDLEIQEKALAQNEKDLKQLGDDVAEEQKKVDIAKNELEAQKQITTTLEESVKDSGYLDAQGKQVTALPSIQEIRDYALKKNARGWGRRAIGATAAGVGVVAGGIGIAAAVETLKGNSDIAQDLGIGAAAVGGLAAAIGIGVGIWKLVSWVKKRREQSKKMKAGGAATKGTYSPLSSNVDQANKRKYMATALYGYLLHGDSVQKHEAEELIKALDPKLHDTIKHHDKSTDAFIKDQIIQHLMDKMASGG